MRLTRHRAGGRRALTALVAAAGLACGLGAGAPAAHAGTGCTWAPIPLASGWQSEQGTYLTGDPSFCVEDDGMVYLSGSAATFSSSAGEVLGYLPAEARPANVIYLDVYTLNGTYGVLRIDTYGNISTYGGTGGSTSYTSLAGVSFPSASVLQWPVSLENGWQSAQSIWNTGNPAVSISNNVVHLSGGVRRPAGNATGATEAVFDLTSQSLWPADNCFWPEVYTYAGGINNISVINGANPEAFFYPAGTLFATNGLYTSLAGISYPAGSAPWQGLALTKGQAAFYDCAGAAYVTEGDVVYLGGAVALPAGFAGTFTVLPPSVRPTHYLYMIASGDVPVMIAPDGTVTVTRPLTAAQAQLPLSGLSYALGS
jgi:hypothetical protein